MNQVANQQDAAPGMGARVALLAASCLSAMGNAVIAPALPAIQDQFADVPGIEVWVGLVMTIPSLSVALTAAFAGIAADRWGSHRVLVGALVLYGVGGAGGLVLDQFASLLVARMVMGLGVAGGLACTMALAGQLFHGEAQRRFIGLKAAVQQFGGVAMIIAGGTLSALSWRHPFAVYLIALPVAVMVFLLVPKPAGVSRQKDGAAPPFPWRRLWPIYLTGSFGMATFYLIPTRIPFHLADLGRPEPALAGTVVAVSVLAGAIAAVFYARLHARWGTPYLLVAAFVLSGIGFAVMASASGVGMIVGGCFITGFGYGLVIPSLMTLMFEGLPDQLKGRASGGLTTALFLGQFVSPLVLGPIVVAASLPDTMYGVSFLLVLAAGGFLRRARTQHI